MNAKSTVVDPAAAAANGGAVVPVSANAGVLMKVIEKAALDPSFDVAKLSALLEVKEKWEATEARKAYNAAFAEFKAEAIEVVKNRPVSEGPLKGKRYAELFSVVNAVTPALTKNGLAASWKLTKDEKDWLEVTCTLRHVLGHSESVSMGAGPDTGGAKNAIQARASAVTYLERYTLKAICGIAEQGDDDDGGGGGGRMAEESLADHLAAIDAASTEEELRKAFAVAWKEAEALKDNSAMRKFGERKETRKAALRKKKGAA